ncbi:MAG: polyprenyl synthetase family protein [Endomicrobia bacterium]|nr:polyprenyl synthetase family protein [Endomicrobiia bacterium]
MKMMNYHFEEEIKNTTTWFSKEFKNLVEKYIKHLPKKYKEMVLYPLFPGGKHIRPLLMFITAKMLGVEIKRVLYPAVSIELIHNYSLIHDDLPCMDDDDYRRGRLALHKKYSEADAVLVGDGLLTLAFEVMADWKVKDYILRKSLKLLSNYIGFMGLIKGQLEDLSHNVFNKKSIKDKNLKEFIENIYINKTAKLIEISILVPAMTGEFEKQKIIQLSKIGKNIGILFQITDDLIDYKNGQDKENLNYPLIWGEKETLNMIDKIKKNIILTINRNFSNKNNKYLIYLVEKISTRKK